jgi:S-adenosylmethionine hydrolase
VLVIDRFGNAVLDLTAAAVREALGRDLDESVSLQVDTPGGTVRQFRRTYGDAVGLGPFLLVNSAGYLELGLAGGRAAEPLQLTRGSRVRLSISGATTRRA